jgi:transposase-like protein
MSSHYSAAFKAKVVLSSLKEEVPTSELSKMYKVPSGVINRWRREAIEALTQC